MCQEKQSSPLSNLTNRSMRTLDPSPYPSSFEIRTHTRTHDRCDNYESITAVMIINPSLKHILASFSPKCKLRCVCVLRNTATLCGDLLHAWLSFPQEFLSPSLFCDMITPETRQNKETNARYTDSDEIARAINPIWQPRPRARDQTNTNVNNRSRPKRLFDQLCSTTREKCYSKFCEKQQQRS